MKFLLDVSVSSRSLENYLVAHGHDVRTAGALDPKASDDRLLATAREEQRNLVTEDKDFGELIFVRRMLHGPIVRLVELSVDQQVNGIAELLENHAANLTGAVIVTVTRARIRVRR